MLFITFSIQCNENYRNLQTVTSSMIYILLVASRFPLLNNKILKQVYCIITLNPWLSHCLLPVCSRASAISLRTDHFPPLDPHPLRTPSSLSVTSSPTCLRRYQRLEALRRNAGDLHVTTSSVCDKDATHTKAGSCSEQASKAMKASSGGGSMRRASSTSNVTRDPSDLRAGITGSAYRSTESLVRTKASNESPCVFPPLKGPDASGSPREQRATIMVPKVRLLRQGSLDSPKRFMLDDQGEEDRSNTLSPTFRETTYMICNRRNPNPIEVVRFPLEKPSSLPRENAFPAESASVMSSWGSESDLSLPPLDTPSIMNMDLRSQSNTPDSFSTFT